MPDIFTGITERLELALSECWYFQNWVAGTAWTAAELRTDRIFVLDGTRKEPVDAAADGSFKTSELTDLRPYAIIYTPEVTGSAWNTGANAAGQLDFYLEQAVGASNYNSLSFAEIAEKILWSSDATKPGLIDLMHATHANHFGFRNFATSGVIQVDPEFAPQTGDFYRCYFTLFYGDEDDRRQ
jgi:hypothetical protein